MVPARTPRTGMENFTRSPVNSGTSASGDTALLMVCIPNIRMEKPVNRVPTFFFLSLFASISIKTPMIARMGEKDDGFSILMNILSP